MFVISGDIALLLGDFSGLDLASIGVLIDSSPPLPIYSKREGVLALGRLYCSIDGTGDMARLDESLTMLLGKESALLLDSTSKDSFGTRNLPAGRYIRSGE